MTRKPLAKIDNHHLICLAFKHRMVPHSAQAATMIVGGAKVWDWELRCPYCDSKRFEIRDDFGNRVPGTHQTYELNPDYRASLGYTQGEYITEIQNRGIWDLMAGD